MRSYITNSKDDVLLTVENLPSGSSVRLAVMDRFDGNVWNLSDSTMSSDSSNYRRVGTSITNNAEGRNSPPHSPWTKDSATTGCPWPEPHPA